MPRKPQPSPRVTWDPISRDVCQFFSPPINHQQHRLMSKMSNISTRNVDVIGAPAALTPPACSSLLAFCCDPPFCVIRSAFSLCQGLASIPRRCRFRSQQRRRSRLAVHACSWSNTHAHECRRHGTRIEVDMLNVWLDPHMPRYLRRNYSLSIQIVRDAAR